MQAFENKKKGYRCKLSPGDSFRGSESQCKRLSGHSMLQWNLCHMVLYLLPNGPKTCVVDA